MRVSVEGPRGCGYRKGGGIYLVSGQLSEPCPLLPYETSVCPTCGEGIRPARGYTWVDGGKLIPPTKHGEDAHWRVCPLGPKHERELTDEEREDWWGPIGRELRDDDFKFVSRLGDKTGLIWIGAMHYKTPQEFMREAAKMGVSRRIAAVPRDFKIGETWVLLGHPKAIEKACPECGDEVGGDPECPVCEGAGFVHKPGVVTAFRPTAIEYVVRGDESDEELEALEARGIEPVKVVRAGEDAPIPVEL